MINNARLLQAEPSVNLATVPYSGDSDDAGAVEPPTFRFQRS
jgi:hypothetical protein